MDLQRTAEHLTARNPDGTPAPPGRAAVSARPGLVVRLKLTEPARLYLYGLGLVAVLGLQLAGVLAGDWPQFARWGLGIALGLIPITEAVRASVYAPATVVGLAITGRGRIPVPTPESDAA